MSSGRNRLTALSLVGTERWRIFDEKADYPGSPLEAFFEEFRDLVAEAEGLVDIDLERATIILVRCAALLTVAADRLILAEVETRP